MVGGRGGSPTYARFFFCYAFERMNTSKMTQMERDGFFFFFFSSSSSFYVSCTNWLNVKMVVMEHLWCDFCCCFLMQKRLLLNVKIGYFSVVTSSLGCLTLGFVERVSFWPSLKISMGSTDFFAFSARTLTARAAWRRCGVSLLTRTTGTCQSCWYL